VSVTCNVTALRYAVKLQVCTNLKTDGNMLWDGSEGIGNVDSECEEDEGTDCEDGNSDAD
jgi:hypothetical protein